MTIQDLGSIGELIAAIATIATLFYLARQVQANTRQAQTASRVEITRDFRNLNSELFDSEVNFAWVTGLRDYPDMPFKERAHFANHFSNQALLFQGIFAQFENGQLEDETYNAYLAFFTGLVATPGGSRWWEDVGRPIYVGKMVAAVDKSIMEGRYPNVLVGGYPIPEDVVAR